MRVLLLLTLFLFAEANAAVYPKPDLNGYVSQHDQPVILSADTCASGRVCHTLPTSCSTVWTTSTSRSQMETDLGKVSNSNRVFCFAPGDYGYLGDTLTIPASASCTATNPCWLINKWNVDNQVLTDPWKTKAGNQVRFNDKWSVDGTNWIISYVRWANFTSGDPEVDVPSGVSGILLNSIEVADATPSSGVVKWLTAENGSSDVTMQRVLCHDSVPMVAREFSCMEAADTDNIAVVNSEFYNVSRGVFCWGGNSSGQRCRGLVVENNDFYQTPSYTTDCNTNTSGDTCGYVKGILEDKSGATSSSPMLVLHNRIWHMRPTDTNGCCTGGGEPGWGFIFSNNNTSDLTSSQYDLVMNNIFEDTERGIGDTRPGPTRNSVIRNIIYKTTDFSNRDYSYAIAFTQGNTSSEVYLNSFIDTDRSLDITKSNNDVLCNAFVFGGRPGVTNGSGLAVDYNAWYGTPVISVGGNHVIDKSSMGKWAALTSYSAGSVVTPSKQLHDSGFSAAADGYIMIATTSGTSGSSEPSWPTTLGATVADGGVTWKVIRGPYTYWRKLLSAPQQATIPYARMDSSAPEAKFCPGPGEPNAIGSRQGVGINDEAP